MYTKKITYHDFDGNEVTEDFHFNLMKSELMEMELEHKGGMKAYIDKIVKAENTKEIAAVFKDLISRSFCVRNPNGKGAIKSKELTDDFLCSEAYSELFMELVTDVNKAADFLNGITPEVDGKQAAVEKVLAEHKSEIDKILSDQQ